jgi:hypothetical protein
MTNSPTSEFQSSVGVAMIRVPVASNLVTNTWKISQRGALRCRVFAELSAGTELGSGCIRYQWPCSFDCSF